MSIEDVVHRLIDLSNAPGEEKAELHETVTPTAAASGEAPASPDVPPPTGDTASEGQ